MAGTDLVTVPNVWYWLRLRRNCSQTHMVATRAAYRYNAVVRPVKWAEPFFSGGRLI